MNKIVTIHSFRQSVGKSTLAANLAVLLAKQGRRVGLVDTDFQGASAHLFFNLHEPRGTFNDFMLGKCDAQQTVHDISEQIGAELPGRLFLSPASTQITDIMQMLKLTMNIDRYTEGLASLEKDLALDILLVDTQAGLSENTLMSIALSQTLLLVLHPARQDFQGSAVTVDVARKLQVPTIHLVLNDTSPNLDEGEATQQLWQNYQCDGVILPHAEELAALGSSQPFVLAYPPHAPGLPEHPLTARLETLAALVLQNPAG